MNRLHWRRFWATQNNVESIAEREFRFGCLPIERRNQTHARTFIGNTVEDGITREQRIARKIHLRHESRQYSGAKKRKMNVRGAPSVLVISPRICTRFDGDKPVRALIVRHQSSTAREIRIEWRGVIVEVMAIASGGICLPQLDQRAANWIAVFIDNVPAHDDSFAEGFARMLPRQIAIGRTNGIVAKNGAE